ARAAFEALKDSSWGPVKLYRSAFFDTAGATVTLRAGDLDPLLGQSYYQLALAPLRRHRSQDMGQPPRPRPTCAPLALPPTPAGWTVERLDPVPTPVAPGAVLTRRFIATVPADAPRSVPYFLRRPLAGALYDWTGVPPEWRGEPFEPPPLEARVRLSVAGQAIALSREVAYRYRDQAIGEIRRPLLVTRDFDIAV